jgi:phage replication O-like protein O
MASPQCEDGYTKIANELLEAFCRHRINGESVQVLFAIMRKTYGYKKTEDWISNSQLVDMTGLTKGNVSRSLSKLITNKIVIKTDNKLRVNKNYDEWVVIKIDNRAKVIKSDTAVIKKDNNSYQKRGTQKIKENTTKEIIPKGIRAEAPVEYGNHEINELLKVFTDKGIKITKQKLNRNAAHRLITKYSFKKSMAAAEYAISVLGKKYAPQILNLLDLEEKMNNLIMYKAKGENENHKRGYEV